MSARRIVSYVTADGGVARIDWKSGYSLEINGTRKIANLYRWVEATGEWAVYIGTADENFPEDLTDDTFQEFICQLEGIFHEIST